MIPHYATPLRIINGRFATVEDGSTADLAQSIGLLVKTEKGERLCVPEYGIDNPLFRTDFNADDIKSVVSKWEPRAVNVQVNVIRNGEAITINLDAEGG